MAESPKHTPESIAAGLRAAAEADDLDVLVPWLETALAENRAGRLETRDLKALNAIAGAAIGRIRKKLDDARKGRGKAARRASRA
jgi:hypothetical protein